MFKNKEKPILELEYSSLPNTLLMKTSYEEGKVFLIGLLKDKDKVKVKLYDLLRKGYDLDRSCNKWGDKFIIRKNNKITGSITLQTY
jgi:hypothetical protein